jgi:hypothetical protein
MFKDIFIEIMMMRLLRSYVYNGFAWELNCFTSGVLNDDKLSHFPDVLVVILATGITYEVLPK